MKPVTEKRRNYPRKSRKKIWRERLAAGECINALISTDLTGGVCAECGKPDREAALRCGRLDAPPEQRPMTLCQNCGSYHNRAICPICDNPEIGERVITALRGGKAA